jgi:hypothetical protein
MAMDGSGSDRRGNPAAGGPRFTVGGVITAALAVVRANVLRFLVIILGVGVPVALLIGGGMAVMAQGVTSTGPGLNVRFDDASPAVWLFFIAAAFLGLLAYFLIQAALTYGALQQLRGGPVTIAACFSNGFAALPRVFLASIILFIAVALTAAVAGAVLGALLGGAGLAGGILMALLFAAVFLYIVVLLWVFIPAIVVERAGPIACFGRSLALTKGRRWAIFAILLIVGVANWVITFLSQKLAEIAPVAGGLIDLASALFFLALGSAMAAVGYYYLRAEKEGIALDDVVTVFD